MTIKKRLIVNFTGYEGLHPKAVRVRHRKIMSDFDKLWQTKTTMSPMVDTKHGSGSMQVTTKAENWETNTEFCQFGTADIFDNYASRSLPRRLFTGSRAFLNILLTGTLWRYGRTSWRFVIFFMWPFLMVLALLALTLGITAAPVLAGFSPLQMLWSLPLALGTSYGLIRALDEKLFISYLLDDWSAAYDRIYDSSKMLRERKAIFTQMLAAKLRDTDADEVIIMGHSLGTVPAIEALAQVWRTEPELIAKQPVSLLAAGSCLLMIALHPRAKTLREDVRTLLNDSPVFWAEFQALTDIIHFYDSEPASALKIATANPPLIRHIRFKFIHSPARYKQAKGNFFKMHLLFISGSQQKNAYDIGMFLHGPFPLKQLLTEWPEQPAPIERLHRNEAA